MALTNAQYDAVMRSFEKRRLDNRHKQEERIREVYRAIPRMEKFDREIGAVALEQAKRLLGGEEDALERLRVKLRELKEEKEALLAMGGFPRDYMEPVYTCPDCRDTGYIGEEKCHCFLQAEIDLLYHQSHLKEILEKENFHTFSYSWYEGEDREIMRRCVMDARMFIENFDSSFQNLLLLGAVGTGKTFLSNCIAKELMDTCHSVVYLTAFQLFELLSRAAFGSEKQNRSYQQTYPYIFDCDLLIIDDLGTELPNSFTVSQFFLCINERILRKKSTLISSNLDMEALRNIYSERALSRIISCYTIRQLPGSDIRIKKKLKPGRPAS